MDCTHGREPIGPKTEQRKTSCEEFWEEMDTLTNIVAISYPTAVEVEEVFLFGPILKRWTPEDAQSAEGLWDQ